MLGFEPEEPVKLDRKILCLKSSPCGYCLSPGPQRCTYEHLQVLFVGRFQHFRFVVRSSEQFSTGGSPSTDHQCPHERTTDSPRKERWWSAGNPHWQRIVGRTLAKAVHEGVRGRVLSISECPVLGAGTDCMVHMLRAATDHDPTATILKVDGIGTCFGLQCWSG